MENKFIIGERVKYIGMIGIIVCSIESNCWMIEFTSDNGNPYYLIAQDIDIKHITDKGE